MANVFTAWFGGNDGKTFKPRHNHRTGTRQALHQLAERTLGSGNLREAVALPAGEDLNEWLAMKTVDLFNEVELVHGMVSDYCTDSCCSVMSAGPKYEYLWADGHEYRQPTKVSAPKYVSCLFAWVQKQLDDESIFPTQPGAPARAPLSAYETRGRSPPFAPALRPWATAPVLGARGCAHSDDDAPARVRLTRLAGASFPSDFQERIQNIFRRLFRVYAHIMYCHFERIVELTFEAHLNSCFKHFAYFVLEFDLVKPEELKPLKPLIERFEQEDNAKFGRWLNRGDSLAVGRSAAVPSAAS